ncbi:MAG: glycosyltransferase [Labilithrix sp.]|nr:glycosyltransferase [Labilithrix sp.]
MTTSTFPRWPADGTARFVEHLARLAAPEWQVTVLAPHHAGAARRERDGSLEVRRYRYWLPESGQRLCYGGGILPNARASRRAALQVPALLGAGLAATWQALEEGYDLLHAHFLVPQGLVAALTRTRVPLVVSVHGSDLHALGSPFARLLQRAVARRAAVITVNSEATARELAARVPGAERRTRLLPMGFAPGIFHAPPDGEPRDRTVVFAGRLSRQKGADVLVEAFPRVLARVPEARLLVNGDGPEATALAARARALGIGARIRFAPAASQEELAARFRASAVTVLPSRSDASGTEGQGLVAIEAMACGCPVVVSRSGGLAALVDDGARGLAVDPGDAEALARAIVATLEDGAAARARAGRAAAWVHGRLSWDRLKPALLAIYDEARAC